MNFTFTEIHATYASYCVEVSIDGWLERLEYYKKMDQDKLKSRFLNGCGYIPMDDSRIETDIDTPDCFGLSALIAFKPKYDDDDKLESVEVDGLMIQLVHRMFKDDAYDAAYANVCRYDLGTYSINTLEEAKQKLNTAVKTYQYCKCNIYSPVKNGWCESCYPYVTEQDDNCSVCLENSGIWVELECKHKIHEHCFKKIENKKCPLCREVSDKILRL